MEKTVPIPSLSPEQLQAARGAATEARRKRAALKDNLRSGKVTLGDALDMACKDEVLAHVKVVDMLKSLPRIGDKRAGEIMERLDIAPNRRVRGLGRHQLDKLRAEFE